tara:strand:+ start:374 stop:1075 length:702 start_codon:yes stop_codon:yes gene_type:complete
MNFKKKILCVIPARGGSRSVKNKNIRLLGGKPLIYYTINEALKVNEILDVVVSTDNYKIAQISKKYEAKVPFIRPKILATNNALSINVVKHSLEFMEKVNNIKYDYVLMLQPTSPFRKSKHIKSAIKKLISNKSDSVVSVVDVIGHHPYRMKIIKNNKLKNYIDQGYEDMRPRQKLPKVYIRNGAIYLNKRSVIIKQNQLVGKNVIPLIMSENDSINIDTYKDFLIAENVFKK